MGLQREIEQIFQKVVEMDLERIARSADPSYHWVTTPPPSMFLYEESVSSGTDITSTPRDYQIVRIDLNPMGIDTANLQRNLPTIRDRRAGRYVPAGPFEDELRKPAPDFDAAYHEYLEDSGAREPIPIVTRNVSTVGGGFTIQVIAVAGVDYVLDSITQAQFAALVAAGKVTMHPLANVDQWPEEVRLGQPPGGGGGAAAPLVYLRADIIDFDAGGVLTPRRLKP